MSSLAILGGKPVRNKNFTDWPIATEKEKEYLSRVINSSGWGVFRGSLVADFGKRFAEYHGAEYGIPCINGTVALEVQLRCLGIGVGDEVITTNLTWVGTATAITSVGAIPIFVDINPSNYCIDTDSIVSKINNKTKAIMPVHLYGSLCDLDKLTNIARKNNIMLIEDAAHVHGSFWKNKGVGTFGVSGSFSFQESKVMTSGEGGIILTNDSDIYKLANSYINCGRFDEDYHLRKVVGTNYRMTEFQAAILLGQLELLEERTHKRQESVKYLNQKISATDFVTTISVQEQVTTQAYYAYVLKFDSASSGISKEIFQRALVAEGLPVRSVYEPIHQNSLFNLNHYDTPIAWSYYENRLLKECYPISEKASYSEGIILPHQVLLGTNKDLDDVVEILEKVIYNIDALREL